MQFVLFTPKQSDCEPKGQIQTIFIVTIDGRYALYAQLNGIALYAFLKLNLALLKSKPVIFRN